jgi:hypothetical protein
MSPEALDRIPGRGRWPAVANAPAKHAAPVSWAGVGVISERTPPACCHLNWINTCFNWMWVSST